MSEGVVGDDVENRPVLAGDDATPLEAGLTLEVLVDVGVRGDEVLWSERGAGRRVVTSRISAMSGVLSGFSGRLVTLGRCEAAAPERPRSAPIEGSATKMIEAY
ncbi:MAG: hypothetical protein ACRDSF_20240 [Pseudonocardiaceae bacterium]